MTQGSLSTIFYISLSLFIMATSELSSQVLNPEYDSTLAASLNADERGMKMYVFVILKTGPATITDSATRDSLFKGHFANINHLADIGKLVVAGPMSKNDLHYRGIFIFDVPTVDEARELMKNDPTIVSGIFDVEVFQWYGSAALPVYKPTTKKINKYKF